MVGLINMRKTNSIWKDVRLRKAVNLAVNRDFLNSVMKGNPEIISGLIPTGYLGHNSELQPYAYDPARARSLLRAAGYKEDLPIKIILPFKTQKIVPMLKEMLTAAGFATKIVPMGINNLVTHFQLINLDRPISEQDWDICIIKHTGSTDHPYLDIYRRYFAQNGLLRWIGDDEELFGLIRQFEEIRDENQQDQILQRCEALHHSKAYMLALYSLPNAFALNKQIHLPSEVTNDQFFLREIELLPGHWSLRP
jgi:ABC-type transport system substrate-binding protein